MAEDNPPIEPGEDADESASSAEEGAEGAGEEILVAKPTVVSPMRREPAPSDRLKSIVESLLFVSDRPVTSKELGRALRTEEKKIREVLDVIAGEWEARGVQLAEVAGGFQLRSNPENAQWVQHYLQVRPVRLSRAALETLAIIAYRQPLTRPEVDDLRGVDSGGVLKLLLDRGLIKIIGKKDEPGRPLLYGTTAAFLELFGLKSLRDLPTLRQFTELTEESQALVDRFDDDNPSPAPAPEAPSPSDSEPSAAAGDAESDAAAESVVATDPDADHADPDEDESGDDDEDDDDDDDDGEDDDDDDDEDDDDEDDDEDDEDDDEDDEDEEEDDTD